MQFYLSEKLSDHLIFMQWDVLKTKALIAYTKVIEYLIMRYHERSINDLNQICKNFVVNFYIKL